MTTNDSAVADLLKGAFVGHFGGCNVVEEAPGSPHEDFSIFATAVGAPYVVLYWWIGMADHNTLERARQRGDIVKAIPVEQSPFSAPLIHPTLVSGVHALSIATLTMFHKA
jgi:hypothetical protein